MTRLASILILCLLLAGCASKTTPAIKPIMSVPLAIMPMTITEPTSEVTALPNGCTQWIQHGRTNTWCLKPVTRLLLLWDYPADSNVVFIVQSSPNISNPTNWPVLAIVSTNGLTALNNGATQFFAVCASNTATKSVSSYATR